jgi:glycine C-acetyltransferase
LAAIDLLEKSDDLRLRLSGNTALFRSEMAAAGFKVLPGEHPIVPVMIGDAELATRMADNLLNRGIFVVGFSYPVVPKGEARIRVQLSASHERDDVLEAVAAFQDARAEVIGPSS